MQLMYPNTMARSAWGIAALAFAGLASAQTSPNNFGLTGPSTSSTCETITLQPNNLPANAPSDVRYIWTVDPASQVQLTPEGNGNLTAGLYGNGFVRIPPEARRTDRSTGTFLVNLAIQYNVTSKATVAPTSTPLTGTSTVVSATTTPMTNTGVSTTNTAPTATPTSATNTGTAASSETTLSGSVTTTQSTASATTSSGAVSSSNTQSTPPNTSDSGSVSGTTNTASQTNTQTTAQTNTGGTTDTASQTNTQTTAQTNTAGTPTSTPSATDTGIVTSASSSTNPNTATNAPTSTDTAGTTASTNSGGNTSSTSGAPTTPPTVSSTPTSEPTVSPTTTATTSGLASSTPATSVSTDASTSTLPTTSTTVVPTTSNTVTTTDLTPTTASTELSTTATSNPATTTTADNQTTSSATDGTTAPTTGTPSATSTEASTDSSTSQSASDSTTGTPTDTSTEVTTSTDTSTEVTSSTETSTEETTSSTTTTEEPTTTVPPMPFRRRARQAAWELNKRVSLNRRQDLITSFSASTNISISVQSTARPSVSIGAEVAYTGSGTALALTAKGAFTSCTGSSNALTYKWTTTVTGGFPEGSTVGSAQLYVPNGLTVTGNQTITVTVTTSGGLTANATIPLLPLPSRLRAVVSPAGDATIGYSQPLLLDASSSADAAYPNAALQFRWTCAATNKDGNSDACPGAITGLTKNFIYVEPKTFSAGWTYNITVIVTQTNPPSATASRSTVIRVSEEEKFGCWLFYDATNTPRNAITKGSVVGFFANCFGVSDQEKASATYRWTVDNANVNLQSSGVFAAGGQNQPYIYLKPGVLNGGVDYKFTVTATTNTGKTATDSDQISLLPAPSGGRATCFPTIGTAFVDQFNIEAPGWVSGSGSSSGLTYRFVVVDGSGLEYPLGSSSSVKAILTALPATGTLTIRVYVTDEYGSQSVYNLGGITSNPISPAQIESAVAAQENAVKAALESGDISTLLAASFASAALVGQSNQGGYANDAAQALAARRQEVVINAMVTFAESAKTADACTQGAKALLRNDISIMPSDAQSSALGALGLFAANLLADTSPTAKPLDRGVVGSTCNTLGNLFPSFRVNRGTLRRRQTTDSGAITYPPKSGDTPLPSAAVQTSALTAAHQSGAAMVKGQTCDVGSVPLTVSGTTSLASNIVPLFVNGSATAIGYKNARVIHPLVASENKQSELDAQPASSRAAFRGCISTSAVVIPSLRGAIASQNYSSQVISVSYARPSQAIYDGLGGSTTIDVWIPEESSAYTSNATKPECRVWNGSKFTATGCTTLESNVEVVDGSTVNVVHCKCPFRPEGALRRRAFSDATVNGFTSSDFVINRVANDLTVPPPGNPGNPGNPAPGDSGKKLSGGAIAGITVGCVAGAAIIAAAGVLVVRARRPRQPQVTAV